MTATKHAHSTEWICHAALTTIIAGLLLLLSIITATKMTETHEVIFLVEEVNEGVPTPEESSENVICLLVAKSTVSTAKTAVEKV